MYDLKLKLRTKIILLFILIILILLILIGLLLNNYLTKIETEQLADNVMNVAQVVAKIPEIYMNIGIVGGMKIIQPLVEDIRFNTNTAYIVIMGMDGIRYSNPDRDNLGEPFIGEDHLKVLEKGESYISQSDGTLGSSVRAFAPIYRGNNQVGAVAVGILKEEINKRINDILWAVNIVLIFGGFLGVVGSILLANDIKKSIYDLEPEEIAKLIQDRNAILNSVKEAIIAIDRENKITFFNKVAREIIGVEGDLKNKNILEIIPNSKIPRVIETGESEFNKEQLINNTVILTNRVPIKIDDQVVGAVASFNKKNVVQKLAEELTGVKKLYEALRSQNHEFMNKLHTILGLIQIEEYETAERLISKVTFNKQEFTTFVMKNIKVEEIAGLLLGKYDHASELKVDFKIERDSHLNKIESPMLKESLIIIIGNLIENSLEGFAKNQKNKKINFAVYDKNKEIEIMVEDNGSGIPKDIQQKVFKRGFSTKSESSGIGLDLIKSKIEFLGGEINLNSEADKGTKFTIVINKNQEVG
jgi:sensor histidine kinase regulating citrate/malate metabolism